MFKWFTDLFKDEEDEIDPKDYTIKCPKCGSEKINYFSGMINFVEVIQNTEEPKYRSTAICSNCGFRSDSEIDDNSNEYLKKFNLIRKEK